MQYVPHTTLDEKCSSFTCVLKLEIGNNFSSKGSKEKHNSDEKTSNGYYPLSQSMIITENFKWLLSPFPIHDYYRSDWVL
jgi:hypothetical protein